MLYVRLAHGGGVVEVFDAAQAVLDEDALTLLAADGHPVCRFPKLDVLAYAPTQDRLQEEPDAAAPGS